MRHDPWLDSDPVYRSLGRTARQRARHYHHFVTAAVPPDEWQLIRDAIQRGQLTGSDRFIDAIAAKMGKRIERRGQGRPRKDREVGK